MSSKKTDSGLATHVLMPLSHWPILSQFPLLPHPSLSIHVEHISTDFVILGCHQEAPSCGMRSVSYTLVGQSVEVRQCIQFTIALSTQPRAVVTLVVSELYQAISIALQSPKTRHGAGMGWHDVPLRSNLGLITEAL